MEKVTRDWQNQYMVPLFCPPDFIPVKGQGCHVWDQEGREYIDISGGIAVNSLGHCNPELVKALTEQANNIWHVSNLLTRSLSCASQSASPRQPSPTSPSSATPARRPMRQR